MRSRWLAPAILIVVASCGSDGSSASTDATTEARPADAPVDADEPSVETAPAVTAAAETTVEDSIVDPAPATAPSDDGGGSPVARPDPCSLWTAADLETATGLAFLAGEFNTQLSVNGQEICDWLTSGDVIANAQVLVLAPGLDYAFLRSGTEAAAGPVTDIDVPGADAAHISADERIVGVGVGGVVLQLAYLPPAGAGGTGGQLTALAEIAAARAGSG